MPGIPISPYLYIAFRPFVTDRRCQIQEWPWISDESAHSRCLCRWPFFRNTERENDDDGQCHNSLIIPGKKRQNEGKLTLLNFRATADKELCEFATVINPKKVLWDKGCDEGFCPKIGAFVPRCNALVTGYNGRFVLHFRHLKRKEQPNLLLFLTIMVWMDLWNFPPG